MHHYLAYVLIGSLLLHIAVKLPDIKYGLEAKLPERRRPHRDPLARESPVAQHRR